MPTLKQRIITLLKITPGLTDREMADQLLGVTKHQAPVNQAARALAASGLIIRRNRHDGKIGNYLSGVPIPEIEQPTLIKVDPTFLSEDDVKQRLEAWLKNAGWQVTVIYGRGHGIDVEAHLGNVRWIIEAKGSGSLNAMRVNYFLSMLGELLQRMNDPNARYSIALPDMPQFRGLWQRLPELAKSRTTISALFVDSSGRVEQVK